MSSLGEALSVSVGILKVGTESSVFAAPTVQKIMSCQCIVSVSEPSLWWAILQMIQCPESCFKDIDPAICILKLSCVHLSCF